MEDEAIIELYWQRNEQAVEETRTKYGAYCYQIAFNLLRRAASGPGWGGWRAISPWAAGTGSTAASGMRG